MNNQAAADPLATMFDRTVETLPRDSLAARLTTEQRAEGDRRVREWSTAFAARE